MNAANGLFLNKFFGERNNFFEINFVIKMSDKSKRRLCTFQNEWEVILCSCCYTSISYGRRRSTLHFHSLKFHILTSRNKCRNENELSNKVYLFEFIWIRFTKKNSDVWIYFVDRYLSSTTSNFSRLQKPVYKSAKGKSFNEWVCTWTSYMITKVRLRCLKLTTGDLFRRPSIDSPSLLAWNTVNNGHEVSS